MGGGFWGCSWLRLVVYRVFFGFLVFSVCVAIYFEYRGCEKLCPNGGCPESAKPDAHAMHQAHAMPKTATAQIVYANSPPTPTPTPSPLMIVLACTSNALIIFVTALCDTTLCDTTLCDTTLCVVIF